MPRTNAPRPPARLRTAGLAVGVLLSFLPHALGAPRDPFSSGLAARDAQPPGDPRASADGPVAESKGTAAYRIPIELPPARGGMAPALALAYSSDGALRGGVAVGWSLELPLIERDPDFPREQRYRTTLGGSSGKLIANTLDPGSGERYRAEVDGEFYRYQRDAGTGLWTAIGPGGHRYEFYQPSSGRWLLTREADPLGNAVTYAYTGVAHDGHQGHVPRVIEYTSNAAAGLGAHARVEFVYDGGTPDAPGPLSVCGAGPAGTGVPVGASVDYRFGFRRLDGARRLDQIRTSVKDTPTSGWRPARTVRLSYDAAELSCAGSALRYLTAVDVVARSPQGIDTVAPATRFSYGPRQRNLTRTLVVEDAPREHGTLDGATSGFLDLDGDGRIDHVEVTSDPRCRLHWRKGLADGQFAPVATAFDLPTADWKVPGQRNPLVERCTLSGQIADRPVIGSTKACLGRGVSVAYHLADWNGDGRMDVLSEPSASPCFMGGDFDDGLSCAPTDDDQQPTTGGCPEGMTQTGAIEGTPVCSCGTGRSYDITTGQCTASCPIGEVYNMLTGNCDAPGTCTEPGNCPLPGDEGNPTPESCLGGAPVPPGPPFVWRVQHGLAGSGGPAIEPYAAATAFNSPRPLPGGGIDLGQLSTTFKPQVPTIIDVDGDGYLDVVGLAQGPFVDPPVIGIPGNHLWVWRGLADGSLAAEPVRWQFAGWSQKAQFTAQTSGYGGHVFTGTTTLAFRDVNGDGLPDLLVQQVQPGTPSTPGELGVSYNEAGFRQAGWPADVVGRFGPVVSLGMISPVEETRADVSSYTNPATWVEGFRGYLRRLEDLDGDGALELVQQVTSGTIGAPAAQMLAYRILGGARSLDYRSLPPGEWEPAESLIVGNRTLPHPWRRHNDLIDLTGDGQLDAVSYTAGGDAIIHTDPLGTPMRLLASVDNGRGGIIRFDYAMTTDPDVVDLGGAALAARPVVAQVTASPGQGQPDLVTRYRYAAPVLGRSGPQEAHPNAPGFLGFARVTVDGSGQPGADARRVVKTFDHTLLGSDGSGRPASEATWIRPAAGAAHALVSYVTHEYGFDYLAGSWASVTYPTRHVERTCRPGQGVAQCVADPAGLLTTDETWTRWAPLNGLLPQVVLNTRTVTSDGVTSPRYVLRDVEKRWTATDGRLLPTLEEKGRVSIALDPNGGTQTTYSPWSRTQTLYDTLGLPVETRVYRDATTYSRTLRTFHPHTGVLQSIRHPNQVASGAFTAEYFYHEPFMVHVTGHQERNGGYRLDTVDMATGALLRRQGPSWRYTSPSNEWAYDTETWTIDGFGRVLRHSDSLDAPPGSMGYDVREVDQFSYHDHEVPSRVVHWRLQTAPTGSSPAIWLGQQEERDGLGRVLRTTVFGGAGDAVTSQAYDAGGAVEAITVQSPAGLGTVTTTYSRDGLGRTTALDRPGDSDEVVTYAGLDVEVLETSVVDGPGARTTLRHNARRELVQVHEHDNPAPGQSAVTIYAYDPLGRMQSIVDADGVTTTLGHDWRGLRTTVARAGRTWTYAYDWNGNMVEQREPVPAGGSVAAYTSTTAYDAMNRPISYTPATRGMTAARLAQLGLGQTTLAYDGNGFHGKPHLITLPGFGTIARTYSHDGQVARETRNIILTQATHGATLSSQQWVERRYDALGKPTTVTWDDGTQWRHAYDSRGDLQDVLWHQPGGAEVVLAHYDRRISGHPYRRTSAWSPQQRDWQYDELGRVVYDRVFRTDNGATHHERSFGYDGHGELRLVQGQTAGMIADAELDYDARHRVTRAQGPLGYDATFTYGRTGNVLTAAVAGAGYGIDRNVTYAYSAAEPQAVERLNDAAGNAVATYAYDTAGNVTGRTAGWSGSTFTFGGDGLLHEAGSWWLGSERYLFGPGADRLVAISGNGVKVWFGESETGFSLAGVQQRRYHHIAGGEPVARAERTTAGSAPSLELQYADTLQSLALTTDQAGQVRSAFVYGAFGEVVGTIDSTDHRRQFNGKEHDLISGLRHYGHRSYDPLSLRWVSADPLFRFAPDSAWSEPQRANLYAFSLNNPLRYLDPDGRKPLRRRATVRSESGGQRTPSQPDAEEAVCPRNGKCDVEVVYADKVVRQEAVLLGVTIVTYTSVQVTATVTFIDGKPVGRPGVSLAVSDVTESPHGGMRDSSRVLTSDLEIKGTVGVDADMAISVGATINGGTTERANGSSVEVSGQAGLELKGLTLGVTVTLGRSRGATKPIYSTISVDESALVKMKFDDQEWRTLATQRVTDAVD